MTTIIGTTGDDTLFGTTGDDAYRVGRQDMVTLVEYADEGHDVVSTDSRWVLGPNFEDLILIGLLNINGFGNELQNYLTGNSGNNYKAYPLRAGCSTYSRRLTSL